MKGVRVQAPIATHHKIEEEEKNVNMKKKMVDKISRQNKTRTDNCNDEQSKNNHRKNDSVSPELWQRGIRNPDFKLGMLICFARYPICCICVFLITLLATINAANKDFQSFMNSITGSYLINMFVEKTEKGLQSRKMPFIGEIFHEIQEELGESKQLPEFKWNNGTENIRFNVNTTNNKFEMPNQEQSIKLKIAKVKPKNKEPIFIEGNPESKVGPVEENNVGANVEKTEIKSIDCDSEGIKVGASDSDQKLFGLRETNEYLNSILQENDIGHSNISTESTHEKSFDSLIENFEHENLNKILEETGVNVSKFDSEVVANNGVQTNNKNGTTIVKEEAQIENILNLQADQSTSM